MSLVPSIGNAQSSQLAVQTKSSIEKIDGAVEGKLGYKPTFWGRENERGLKIDIIMHPTSLTLHDDNKPYIRAQFLGIQSCVLFQRLRMDLNFTIQGYLIEDLNTDSLYRVLLSKVDYNAPFLNLKVSAFKQATIGKNYCDLEQKDLSIEANIGEMRLVVLAPLIAKVIPYFTQLTALDFQDNALLDSAKDAATATVTQTAAVAKEKKNNRVLFNITIQAPSVVIPLSSTSNNVFLINLGDLKINNQFKFASDVYGGGASDEKWVRQDGNPIIVDKMQISFNDLKIQQSSNFNPDKTDNESFAILNPVNFEFILNRVLYELSDNEIPIFNSSAKIDSITLHIRPCDLVNLAYIGKSLTIITAAFEVSKNRAKVRQNQIKSPIVSPKKGVVQDKLSKKSNFFMLTANLNTIRVVIYTRYESFADISVNQLYLKTCLKSQVTTAEASIKSFRIMDLAPGSMYSKILTTPTSDANVIEVGMKIFNNATRGEHFFDINKHDMEFKLTLGKIEINLVYSFISKVIATFLDIKINRSTLNAVKSIAKKQAVETASSTVEKIGEKQNKRILILASFQAPLIVIPTSIESFESLKIDLGLITAKNSFSLEKPDLQNYPDYSFPLDITDENLIFDFIEFNISSIQLYRMTAQNERATPILNSFELNLHIVRTLPFSVTEIPQYVLAVTLSPMAMVFSLDDYCTVMNIVKKNFLQGSKLNTPISEDEKDNLALIVDDPIESSTPTQRTFPFISVYFNFQEYSLTLNANEQTLTKLTVSGVRVELHSVEKSLSLIGQLKDLSLRDMSTDTMYPKIVTLDPSVTNVISFSINYYLNNITEQTPELSNSNYNYDLAIDLNVGQIDIYILNSYISKLINFATQFSPQTVKKKPGITKETELQKEKGLEDNLKSILEIVDNFAKLKQRLKIEINFKAPRIIIPKNRNSTHALIADLGYLTVKSSPILKSMTSPTNPTPIYILYDNIQPVLSKFKLSRAFLRHDSNTDSFTPTVIRPLITEFSLEMSIQRRLTVSVTCPAPFLLLNIHLTDMSFLIGSKDIRMILDTIIAQVEDRDKTIKPKEKVPPIQPFSPEESPVKIPQVESAPQKSKIRHKQDSYFSDPTTPLIKADIQIDSVGIKLYYKDEDIQETVQEGSEPEIQPIPEDKYLTKLAIVGSSLQFSLNKNLEADLIFEINDITLHDLRIQRRRMINQMLSRSILSHSSDAKSLLTVNINRLLDGDLTIQIKVTNMTLLVSPEFIVTLILYFGEHFERLQQLKVTQQSSEILASRRRSVAVLSRPETAKKRSKTNTKKNLESLIPAVKIILALKNPTILFLEDASDTNSRTLVGNVEASGIFKVDESRDISSTFSITDVKLYTCYYKTIHQPYSSVLEPVNLYVSMLHFAKDITVSCDNIIINISPSTLALLTNIAQSFNFPNENDLGYAPIDLWEAGHVNIREWFVRPTHSIMESTLITTGTSSASQTESERLELDINSIDIKLESEYSGIVTPILFVHAYMEATIINWTGALELEANLRLEASYYNIKLTTWEPLIEPALLVNKNKFIPFRLRSNFYLKDRNLKKNVVKIAENDSQSQALLADSTLVVAGLDGLSLILTREFIEILYKYLQEVTIGRKIAVNIPTTPTKPIDSSPKNSLYLIENVLGVSVSVELRVEDKLFFDSTTKSTIFELASNSKQNVISSVSKYDLSQAILSKQSSFTEHFISIAVSGFEYKLPSIPISKIGNFLYKLPSFATDNQVYYIVVDISVLNKQKHILIRSSMRINNNMELNIEVFSDLITSPQSTPTSIAVIKPCESYHVTLEHAHRNSFMLAPYQLGYTPANFVFNRESKFESTNIGCQAMSRTETTFYMTVAISEEEFTREPVKFRSNAVNIPKHIVSLHFSCVLHNLLPVVLKYEVDATHFRSTIKPGEASSVLFAKIGRDSVICLSLEIFGQTLTGKLALRHHDGISECTVKNANSPAKVSMSLGK